MMEASGEGGQAVEDVGDCLIGKEGSCSVGWWPRRNTGQELEGCGCAIVRECQGPWLDLGRLHHDVIHSESLIK